MITGLGVGGAERQVVDLAERMVDRGHQVEIAYLTGEATLRPARDGVVLTGFGMAKSVGGGASAYGRLGRLVRTFRPDVVHSHMVHANLLARLVRLTTPIPRLVCTAHNVDEGGALRMLAYRMTDGLADLSTNVSGEAVAGFEARGAARPGRMIAVPNGIDTVRFCRAVAAASGRPVSARAGVPAAGRVILAVGRLFEQKDYPNLLSAFARLGTVDRDPHLLIAGDGPLRDDLARLAVDIGVSDRVHFLGVRPDVPELLNEADVFVLPSAWEGFGLVVGEAMACEKVVVATDCGGVRELVGDCGYLVPPRDAAALGDSLGLALHLPPTEAERLGVRARERIVARFSLERAVDTWLEIYAGRASRRAANDDHGGDHD